MSTLLDAHHPAMPLSLAPAGQTVTIHQVNGGRSTRQRLFDLGLNQGAHVRVVQNDMLGPMIIAVRMTVMIALAGNPNVGKSTIFNALTGSRQHVGNWPGKTVEKKEGRLRIGEREILLVDLPGAYSLTAYSIEEIIARDFIVNERIRRPWSPWSMPPTWSATSTWWPRCWSCKRRSSWP
jgi:Fe2+ transport system protein FeoA